MTTGMREDSIDRLARLFLEHPAWVTAARRLAPQATSTVYFAHRPGEPWRLEHREGRTRLLPGAAADPDFVFRFAATSAERLETVRGGIGDFAVALFTLITEEDPEARVDFRIVAGFPRLVRRGYLGLLVAAGPRVVAFGASHGIRTLAALRRFAAQRRAGTPEPWEVEDGETALRT
ncbi:MAG: hypothetical protein OEM05_19390 [Myxococcales bacterium]|nr:hypothetical protein [Myxococcales bacterium]